MKEEILKEFEYKNILILGFGKEGKSTYNFIRKYYPNKVIGIADKKNINTEGLENVVLHLGEDYEECIKEYNFIIKSPGIKIEVGINEQIQEVTTQTMMFLKYFSNQTIGITGTKGKSTTTSLIYHILKNSNKNVLLAGNIGIPVFDTVEEIDKETLIVYELSAHQLKDVKNSPHISVLLNIFEEHLDFFGDMKTYINSKNNIFKFQNENDYLICNRKILPNQCMSKVISITPDEEDADIKIKNLDIIQNGKILNLNKESTRLKGQHNIYNIAVAYAVSNILGINQTEFLDSLKTFKPLEHRLEYVGEFDNIKYYNDSISTVCETTIQAIQAIENVDSLIIGGMNRGINYEPLAKFLLESDVRLIILMPDTGMIINNILLELSNNTYNNKQVKLVNNLKEAVDIAKEQTTKGKVCLLSPAASSYNAFENFEERGRIFKKLVSENKV